MFMGGSLGLELWNCGGRPPSRVPELEAEGAQQGSGPHTSRPPGSRPPPRPGTTWQDPQRE